MANDVLLDYAFELTLKTPLPAASAAFLRRVLAVVKPKSGVEAGQISSVLPAAAADLTDNTDVEQLFAGGLSRVLVLPTDTLDIASAIAATPEKFFTVLISSDFDAEDMKGLKLGSFAGVVGYTFSDKSAAKEFAVQEKQCGFYGLAKNKSENMFFSFGALLSGDPWSNQQFIAVPNDDGITEKGDAEALFEDRVSFALTSEQYGHRLGFFVVGGAAIIAPYVIEDVKLALQSMHVQYVSANKPQYTMTEAKVLEEVLQDVIDGYVSKKLIARGSITVTPDQDDFVASVAVSVTKPSALWRLKGTLTQEVA